MKVPSLSLIFIAIGTFFWAALMMMGSRSSRETDNCFIHEYREVPKGYQVLMDSGDGQILRAERLELCLRNHQFTDFERQQLLGAFDGTPSFLTFFEGDKPNPYPDMVKIVNDYFSSQLGEPLRNNVAGDIPVRILYRDYGQTASKAKGAAN